MENKKEALQYIRILAEQKVVTKNELDSAFDLGNEIKTDVILKRRLGISEVLYYVGGAVVFLGISIFLSQNWATIGFDTKVLTTLGVGIATYFVGVLFGKDERTETAGTVFYLISALVTPIGLWVVFNNAGLDASSHGTQSLISGILLAMYLLSFVVSRKNVFTLLSILFGTWFFFSFTSFMIGGNLYFDNWEFYEYRILVVSITYILLGYAFSENKHVSLQGFLYGFGIFGFLGTALALGGWEPNQNIFWELIYPGLVSGALFLSVQIKSKTFLVWSTFFLMTYILKITSEYFSTGLGWPLSLIVAGLAMVGVGYVSISLKKKYLTI